MASSKGTASNAASFVVWAIAIGVFLTLFFGIPAKPGLTLANFSELLQSKSKTLEAWFQNCVPSLLQGDSSNCDLQGYLIADNGNITIPSENPNFPGGGNNPGGGGGSTPGGGGDNGGGTGEGVPGGGSERDVSTLPLKAAALEQLNSLKVAPAENIKYDRKEWNHWVTLNGSSCWDVRDAVLQRDAVQGTQQYLDKNKQPSNAQNACSVESAVWVDVYTGSKMTSAKDIDIDHMIPLKYAATHGGQSWSKEKKQQYANDMTYPGHLLAVKNSENRSKSDKGPSAWKPKDTSYHCTYAKDWIQVSTNYGLTIDAADVKALKGMLETCTS